MQTPPDLTSAHATDRQERAAGGRQQRPRVGTTLILRVVAVLLLALLLLYGALWGYRFALSQLGPFAPLAAGLVLALVLAIGGPWLLVREGTRLADAGP